MVTKVKSGVIGDNTVGITQLNVSDGSDGQFLRTNGAGTLSFATISAGVDGISSSANATAITIDSSERVAIGSSTANKIFNIADPNQGGDTLKLEFEAESSTDKFAIYAYDRTNSHYANMSLGQNAIWINGADANIGIGNTSPSSYSANARNLVVGSGSGNNGITITSATDGQSRLFFADGTSGGAEYDGFVYYDHASQLMSFGTGATGAQSLNIDSTGKVGIKVTTPSEALHIEGNTVAGGNNYIYLRKSDQASNQGIYIGQATSNNDLKIIQRANNAIVFQNTTSETERLRIDEAGLIRINQAASYDCGKLIVYGGASTGQNGGTLHYNGTSRQYLNCVSNHTAAGSHRWWNIKTNIQASNFVMYVARVHGYGYGNSGAIVDIYRSGYAHTSTGTFTNQNTKNNGSSSDTLVAYYSSDGYVCFKHTMPSSGYYSGLAFDIAMYSPTGYNFDFEVLGNSWSTSSSNYY